MLKKIKDLLPLPIFTCTRFSFSFLPHNTDNKSELYELMSYFTVFSNTKGATPEMAPSPGPENSSAVTRGGQKWKRWVDGTAGSQCSGARPGLAGQRRQKVP